MSWPPYEQGVRVDNVLHVAYEVDAGVGAYIVTYCDVWKHVSLYTRDLQSLQHASPTCLQCIGQRK